MSAVSNASWRRSESFMPRALVTDIAGKDITAAERTFLRALDPLGIILFSRNIADPAQVAGLVDEFRACVARPDAPVMVDQEGGRVARLREPHWWSGVSALRLGRAGPRAAWLAARLLAREMAGLGIDVTCAPCLDLGLEGMHDVIGDRAFAADPDTVTECGRAFADGLAAGGVQCVIKHLPGHGRVTVDPHEALPVSRAALAVLRRHDFVPFRNLSDSPWGIVGHVVYAAIDEDRPASCSPAVVHRIIRRELEFDGVLLSDAIDMEALPGSHEQRARLCLEAGCDVVIHCNQPLDRRERVAAAVPELAGDSLRRVRAAASMRPRPDPEFDRARAFDELHALLEAA